MMNKDTKFTPGPWRFHSDIDDSLDLCVTAYNDRRVICDVSHAVEEEVDQLDLGVRRLHDGVGGEGWGHEDHGGVAARSLTGLGHGVEDRNAVHLLAALARGHPGHHLGTVIAAAEGVELALLARDALHQEPRVVVDPNRHRSNLPAPRRPPWPRRPPCRRRQ